MDLENINIGFTMTGSFCTFKKVIPKIKELKDLGANIIPIMSYNSYNLDTKFGKAKEFIDEIENITGNRTKLYRAPYGEYNNTVIKSATDKGYYTIQWSLDTLDYTGLSGKEMWNRLDTKLSSGDIILMHNGTKHTADSLDMIINNIKQNGYQIVPVSELIYKEDYKIDATGLQIKN